MVLVTRRVEDECDVLELPSPCTRRKGENPRMGVKIPPYVGPAKAAGGVVCNPAVVEPTMMRSGSGGDAGGLAHGNDIAQNLDGIEAPP